MSQSKKELEVLPHGNKSYAPLFLQYPGQCQPQRAYLNICFTNGTIYLDSDGEIGNAIPGDVWNKKMIMLEVPNNLSEWQCDNLIEEVLPIANKMYEKYEENWNGSNWKGNVDEMSIEETEIENIIRGYEGEILVYENWIDAYGEDKEQMLEDYENDDICPGSWPEPAIIIEDIETAIKNIKEENE